MKTRLFALLALLAVPIAAVADDGMWMPQQVPALGDELKKLGLQIDPKAFAAALAGKCRGWEGVSTTSGRSPKP